MKSEGKGKTGSHKFIDRGLHGGYWRHSGPSKKKIKQREAMAWKKVQKECSYQQLKKPIFVSFVKK